MSDDHVVSEGDVQLSGEDSDGNQHHTAGSASRKKRRAAINARAAGFKPAAMNGVRNGNHADNRQERREGELAKLQFACWRYAQYLRACHSSPTTAGH